MRVVFIDVLIGVQGSSVECGSPSFTKALAGQIDAVCIVDDAVQYGIGQGGIAERFMMPSSSMG
jgi:hypothetical protein